MCYLHWVDGCLSSGSSQTASNESFITLEISIFIPSTNDILDLQSYTANEEKKHNCQGSVMDETSDILSVQKAWCHKFAINVAECLVYKYFIVMLTQFALFWLIFFFALIFVEYSLHLIQI